MEVELFPIPLFTQMRPIFDFKKFYANIISFDEDEVHNGLLDVDQA